MSLFHIHGRPHEGHGGKGTAHKGHGFEATHVVLPEYGIKAVYDKEARRLSLTKQTSTDTFTHSFYVESGEHNTTHYSFGKTESTIGVTPLPAGPEEMALSEEEAEAVVGSLSGVPKRDLRAIRDHLMGIIPKEEG